MKVQKILTFIPIVNLFLIFYWIFYKGNKLRTSNRDIRYSLFKFMILAILLNIPRIFISLLENELIDIICLCISVYLIGIVAGFVVIKAQIIQIKKNKKDEYYSN